LEELHTVAPFDRDIAGELINQKFAGAPTFDQANAVYGPLLDYSSVVMLRVANRAREKPDEFEKQVSKAAALEPRRYFLLADYFRDRGDQAKSIQFAKLGHLKSTDRVSAASYAGLLVDHYLDSGDRAQAKKVADEAGEVYSASGLRAKAWYHERVGEVSEAMRWHELSVERYGSPGELLMFCNRQIGKSKDARFVAKLQAVVDRYRPATVEKVSLADFTKPPVDGTAFSGSSPELLKAGLKAGDVVVAIYGNRIHSNTEYTLVRDTSTNTGLEIIVWDGSKYREVKASPPEKRFGVNMLPYRAP
jgi:hypothetical protein